MNIKILVLQIHWNKKHDFHEDLRTIKRQNTFYLYIKYTSLGMFSWFYATESIHKVTFNFWE